MPNENPSPRSFFAEIETALHALSLYGAAGLAAFGWAMGWLINLPSAEWLPLWFCAALLIYNADRLRRDPADALNVPARTAATKRLRTASTVAAALATLVLIGLPVWRRDWLTLTLIIGGSIVSLGYSIPIFGFRWKDVPFLKTLFAPAIIALAVFYPVLSALNSAFYFLDAIKGLGLVNGLPSLAAWSFLYLLFNMLLCDLRDRAGDAQCGVRSIPVVFGEKGARRMLWALAVVGQALLVSLIHAHRIGARPLAFLALFSGLHQACLLHATRRPRSERFYEWAVEGLLYVPAVACGLAILLSHIVRDDV